MSIAQKLAIGIDREAIADFCRHNRIRKLSLFGSVLRDDFHDDSDVDVLVEFEPEADAEVSLFELADMEEELEGIVGWRVDLREPAELGKARAAVVSEAMVIYAAPEGSRSLRAHAGLRRWCPRTGDGP